MQTSKRELTLGHVGMGTGMFEPFDQVYDRSVYLKPGDLEGGVDCDAIVIWGGGDISPSLYGDDVADLCGATENLSTRDKVEADVCHEAINRGIPVIGVCRGAQLVCALAGGRLLQHVKGHAGYPHLITTFDGEQVKSSSVHHQMMYPFDVKHEMIAWSSEPRSRGTYIIGNNESDPLMEDKPEPEIVWFEGIKALAIQGHPEFHHDPETDPFVQYCMKMVRKFIIGDQQ